MVTKGIIQSINFNGNTCTLRLPFFETTHNDPIITNATFSNAPGIYNGYKVNDVVWVAFEDGQMETPVVLGKLYLGAEKEKADPRGTINTETFNASKTATIPADTTLKTGTDKNIPNTAYPYNSLASVANDLNSLNKDVEYHNWYYENKIKNLSSVANGKSTTYYSETDPSKDPNITLNIGDTWFHTVTNEEEKFYKVADKFDAKDAYIGYWIKDSSQPNGYLEITADNINDLDESNLPEAYTKATLFEWDGLKWREVDNEIVANKLTVNKINAMGITAKKIEVKDNDDTLFLADGLNNKHEVKIAGFVVDKNSLTSLKEDDTKHIIGEDGSVIVSKGTSDTNNISIGGSNTDLSGWNFTAGSNFGVRTANDGKSELYVNSGKLANWTINEEAINAIINDDPINNQDKINTAAENAASIFDNQGEGAAGLIGENKIYFGKDGLNYNDIFYVHKNGHITALEGQIGQWSMDKYGLFSEAMQLDLQQFKLNSINSRLLLGNNLLLFNEENHDGAEDEKNPSGVVFNKNLDQNTGRIRPNLGRLWITDITGTGGLEFSTKNNMEINTRTFYVALRAVPEDNYSSFGKKYKLQYTLIKPNNITVDKPSRPYSATYYIRYLTISGWQTKTIYFLISNENDTIYSWSDYGKLADIPEARWTTLTVDDTTPYYIEDVLPWIDNDNKARPTLQIATDTNGFKDDTELINNEFSKYLILDNNKVFYYSSDPNELFTVTIDNSGKTGPKVLNFTGTTHTDGGAVKVIGKILPFGNTVKDHTSSSDTTTITYYRTTETIGEDSDTGSFDEAYIRNLYVDKIFIKNIDTTKTGTDAFTTTNVKGWKGNDYSINSITFRPGGGGGGGCFEAGTKITMADGSLKNIEDIKKGDKVLSYDVYTNTLSEQEVEMPVELVEPLDNVQLIFSDGTVLNTTMTHPFWTTSGWVSLKPNYDYNDLYKELKDQFTEMMQVGQKFFKLKGRKHKLKKVKLLRIRYYHGRASDHKVYNLSIKNYATFFANGILGHNARVKFEYLTA